MKRICHLRFSQRWMLKNLQNWHKDAIRIYQDTARIYLDEYDKSKK